MLSSYLEEYKLEQQAFKDLFDQEYTADSAQKMFNQDALHPGISKK